MSQSVYVFNLTNHNFPVNAAHREDLIDPVIWENGACIIKISCSVVAEA